MNAGDFRAASLTGNLVPTGIDDNPETSLHLYYDAAMRELTLVPNSVSVRVKLFNIQGMPVLQPHWDLTPQNGSRNVSFRNMPDGIYFVASESKGRNNVVKLIVFDVNQNY
jgi:hypothetical protein